MKKNHLGNQILGDRKSLFLIAGPCVIENKDHVFFMAEKIKKVVDSLGIQFIFKSSYDKANRTSIGSYRGPGIDEGLSILNDVKSQFDVPILTDVHTSDEVKQAKSVVDIIQIPAFLCRQTDLIVEAAKSGCILNIKKGQFLSPWDMKNIVIKAEESGCNQILLTERGVSFGYQNLVNDMRSIPIMKELGYPVIFDGTHSVQQPGGLGSTTGGDRQYVPVLSRAAVASGCDGLFWEVHDNPDGAPSDGPNMMKLSDLEKNLSQMKAVFEVCKEFVSSS